MFNQALKISLTIVLPRSSKGFKGLTIHIRTEATLVEWGVRFSILLNFWFSTSWGGGARFKKKLLGFEQSRTTQMALKFLLFFLEFFKKYFGFLSFVKIIYANLFLFRGIFFIENQKIQIGSVQNETMQNFNKLLYQIYFQEKLIGGHLILEIYLIMVKCYTPPYYIHLI